MSALLSRDTSNGMMHNPWPKHAALLVSLGLGAVCSFSCQKALERRGENLANLLWAISVQRESAAKFAYLVISNGVMQYSVNPDTGALTSLGTLNLPGAVQPLTIDSGQRMIYTSLGTSLLAALRIDANTGTLSQSSTAFAPGTGRSITLHPRLPTAYLNDAGGNVYYYSLSSAGDVTLGGNIAMALNNSRLVIPPSGLTGYSASLSALNVSIFPIDQVSGAVSTPSTAVSISNPTSFSMAPNGLIAYTVGSAAANQINMYSVDTTTGALANNGTQTINGPNSPPLTIDSQGRFAYVGNTSGADVSAFTINQTTAILSLIGNAAAENTPGEIVIHPNGRFAYLSNFTSASVSAFTIDSTTGAISSLASVAANTNPRRPTMDIRGRNLYVQSQTDLTIAVFSIDQSTGHLTLVQTIASGNSNTPVLLASHPKYLFPPGWVIE